MSRHVRFATALGLMLPAIGMAQIGPPPSPTATRPVVVAPPAPLPTPCALRRWTACPGRWRR